MLVNSLQKKKILMLATLFECSGSFTQCCSTSTPPVRGLLLIPTLWWGDAPNFFLHHTAPRLVPHPGRDPQRSLPVTQLYYRQPGMQPKQQLMNERMLPEGCCTPTQTPDGAAMLCLKASINLWVLSTFTDS